MSNLTQELIESDGFINPRNMANTFETTVKTLASISGLSVDAISKSKRARSKKSQERLREMLLIINRATPWCGSIFQAYAWYRSEPLPSLGDLTAETLVKQGYANHVLQHIDRIAQGGYA
jgi:hypothetical protein